MGIVHRLVGYDRQTDRMRLRFDVPVNLLPEAKEITKVPVDDPDTVWSYPLTGARVRGIARLIGVQADPSEAEFFLEAFANPPSCAAGC
jgi:hypothetical protein